MAGFDRPNYTQTPNIFFDEMMAQMGEAELRVALVIMRETFGWHRGSKVMSLSYLQKATGMSRQGVKNGIDAGLERGIFWRKANGDSFEYGLVVNEVDQGSQRSRPGVVNEVDTTNKEKEKSKRGLTPSERDRYSDSVLELLKDCYKASPLGDVRSRVDFERRLDAHVDLIEIYGWETYVRGVNAVMQWKDARYAGNVEAQIVRDQKAAEAPPQVSKSQEQRGIVKMTFRN